MHQETDELPQTFQFDFYMTPEKGFWNFINQRSLKSVPINLDKFVGKTCKANYGGDLVKLKKQIMFVTRINAESLIASHPHLKCCHL